MYLLTWASPRGWLRLPSEQIRLEYAHPAAWGAGHDGSGAVDRLEVAGVEYIVDVGLNAPLRTPCVPGIRGEGIPFREPGELVVVEIIPFTSAARDDAKT